MAIILNEDDLGRLYQTPAALDDLINLIEDSLRAHSGDEVAGQTRVETSLVDPKKKFRIMTAAVPGAGFGVRISALFPGAKDAYFQLLFDNDSGDLLAMLAGRGLNVWRTGAPAGVACRHLAPPNAKTMGLLGSGHQARGQLAAISRALPSLQHAKVFSPTQAHRSAFAKEMSAWLGIAIEAVNSPREAIEHAAVVSLATNSRANVVEADWISAGALVVSITSGQLPETLVASSRVIVSWKEEVLAGEAPRQPYARMIAAGTWSGDKIAGELGEVILGKIPARHNPGETVVFESVGMPSWDTTATAWAYRWAKETQIGKSFSLD
jgi:ornithine cyclodeaminase/alanine dehydrogenase-like protein (mu-crystallin family)